MKKAGLPCRQATCEGWGDSRKVERATLLLLYDAEKTSVGVGTARKMRCCHGFDICMCNSGKVLEGKRCGRRSSRAGQALWALPSDFERIIVRP
jgi:hypothetical protein